MYGQLKSSWVIVAAGCGVIVLSGFLCGCEGSKGDGDAAACNQRGIAHAQAGRHAEAIAEFRKAIAIRPDSAEAHCNMGTAHNRLRQYADAVAAYKKAVALKPDYINIGKFDEAITACEKAVAVKPDFAGAYYNRATAYYYKGNYDKAWADVKTCRRLGVDVDPKLLAELRKVSGREE